MRIPSGVTDQYCYFVAVDITDLKTRETGLSSFTVYRSRDGAAAAAMTTPTVNETDATNMPGVYELLLDEDTTIAAGNDSEELALHITHASMSPVTRVIELYRPKITAGYTLGVGSDGDLLEVNTLTGHTAQTADNPTATAIVNEWETQSQTDPTGFHVNVKEVNGTAQTANDNGADINAILTDTDNLQSNQGNWATVTGYATEAKQDIIDTNIDQIETAVITNATGTDIAADIIALKAETVTILADTADLQTSQGDWATATGFATETKQDIIDTNIDQLETAIITNAAGTDIAADIIAVKAETANILTDTGTTLDGKIDTIDGIVDTILIDTADLQTSQGDWATATGFATPTNITAGTIASITNQVTADVTAISGDTTAADNLEAQYDTTGLAGETFPATQSQISNIASGTAATNQTANSFTKAGTETETLTYLATLAHDGTVHVVEPGGGTTDFYYEFDIGANGSPVSISWHGYAAGQGDSYEIYAWNWTGTPAWEQIGTKAGVNGTTIVAETYDLSIAHVGTGANAGLVRYRVYSTGATTGTAYGTDRILCSFATVYQSVGYADGSIWVDTVNGVAGTTDYINGTADNPVLTWANALTLSTSLGIKRFHILNGSIIQLSATSDNYTFLGNEWTLDLNGQSIHDMFVEYANIYGTSTGTNYRFMMCKIALSSAVSLQAGGMRACAIGDSGVTLSAGTFLWDACFSGVAGTGTPYIDFNTAGDTNMNMRHYSGGIEIRNLGTTGADNMSLEGNGQYVLNANCAGGTFAVRGAFQKTDNSGSVIISDEANLFSGVIDAGRAQTGTSNTITLASTASASNGAYDPSQIAITGGTGDGQCRLILEYNGTTKIAVVDRDWKVNPDSTSDYKITINPGREHVNEGLAQAGAAGTITLNALASSNDNSYNNQICFIRSGTGEDQVRLITDYNGTTKVATVNENWAVNPDATSGYVMLPSILINPVDIASILSDTDELQTSQGDWATATGFATPTNITAGTITTTTNLTNAPTNGDLTATMKTSVNTEVSDVLKTDTVAEMSQGAPPVAPTMEEMINYIYRKLRNKEETIANETATYDDAGTTKLFKSTLSDNGTTFTKSEAISG